MLIDFLKYISEKKLTSKGEKILAAVSGGIDSMVMADLLLKAGILKGIAHCNFSLRGKESDKDEIHVRSYARRHKVPFHSIRFSTAAYAKERGISIEMAARELRYSWFEKIRSEHGYDLVAVAHNLNDNAETVLLNLTRGTGIAGLTGMKPSGGRIIRPMLFASRESIQKYAIENRISYREDRTNSDIRIIRNKIRHTILPLMKEINPSVVSSIAETSERVEEAYHIVSDRAAEVRKSAIRNEKCNWHASTEKLKPFIGNSTLILEVFKPFGITGSLVGDLIKLISGRTGGQIYSGSHRFIKNRDEIIITEKNIEEAERIRIERPEEFRKCRCFKSFSIEPVVSKGLIRTDPLTACLDFDRIVFPVIIRKWEPGDTFHPFGMNRKKKLSDYFIDRKFSRLRKDITLVMETDGKIAWIIGERIDNRFRISGTTKRALIITAQQ
jgi:tRNA(Ile)-lysidine synthase